jgi:4-carboxymuconolactone decarboxylase
MYPDDIDPQSGCRLPLPSREELGQEGRRIYDSLADPNGGTLRGLRGPGGIMLHREELGQEGRRIYDSLADPNGGTLRGLRGPGGIMLHSEELARRSRPVNRYLRHEAGLGPRVRELAILATARELDSQFEWAAHEAEALREGVAADVVEAVKHRRELAAIDPGDAVVVELAREIFTVRKVSSATFARGLALFGRKKLVELVALMGNYAATAALLTAFDMQLDPDREPPLPPC